MTEERLLWRSIIDDDELKKIVDQAASVFTTSWRTAIKSVWQYMLDAESELKEAASWAVMLMMMWRHDARRALIYVLSEQLVQPQQLMRWDEMQR